MSLSLIQGYSSAEEEQEQEQEEQQLQYDNSSSEDEQNDVVSRNRYKPFINPNPNPSSSLPSALDVFSEISGPPEFLNNSVEEAGKEVDVNHGRRRYSRKKNDLPAGAVVEAKPQLVGIHERVRSDVDGGIPKTTTGQANVSVGTVQGGKPAPTASYPGAEDAAELLRLCVRCGIPKTYSHNRGIVCPACGDHPVDTDQESAKKKGSTVKDKEKNKRMKGQSSHATWKSETEMQLRQQFD